MLNRRQFIKAVGIGTAGAVAAPKLLFAAAKTTSATSVEEIIKTTLAADAKAVMDSVSVGQVWNVDTLAGCMYSDDLAQHLRDALVPIAKYRNMS